MIALDWERQKLERRRPDLRDERREQERAKAEQACKRGVEFTSKSGRKFRGGGPAFVGAKPIQLELAACSGKTARPRTVTRDALEARGAAALAELDAPAPKRPRTTWLAYMSVGGERLATELHGLTQAEADYVRHVSEGRPLTTDRIVVWPSQSTAPIRRIDHE